MEEGTEVIVETGWKTMQGAGTEKNAKKTEMRNDSYNNRCIT